MTSPSQNSLEAINSATLGTAMPTVTLPDGRKVQTGTVGALIVNIKEYDAIVAQGSGGDVKKKEELEGKLKAAMGTLKVAGIFDLFTPDEWVRGGSAGRRFVGELAKMEGL